MTFCIYIATGLVWWCCPLCTDHNSDLLSALPVADVAGSCGMIIFTDRPLLFTKKEWLLDRLGDYVMPLMVFIYNFT